MINVVYNIVNDKINLIKIEGHSNFSHLGTDIVCAGISSVAEGSLSFFENNYSDYFFFKRESGKIEIILKEGKIINDSLQVCLQMFVYQLKNIANFYPDYISITKI